jgi:hypothetical protein
MIDIDTKTAVFMFLALLLVSWIQSLTYRKSDDGPPKDYIPDDDDKDEDVVDYTPDDKE